MKWASTIHQSLPSILIQQNNYYKLANIPHSCTRSVLTVCSSSFPSYCIPSYVFLLLFPILLLLLLLHSYYYFLLLLPLVLLLLVLCVEQTKSYGKEQNTVSAKTWVQRWPEENCTSWQWCWYWCHCSCLHLHDSNNRQLWIFSMPRYPPPHTSCPVPVKYCYGRFISACSLLLIRTCTVFEGI